MDVQIRQARTVDTRNRLMRAMEKLCATHGVENVTVKALITEAEQKNESALHYHFKNKDGLMVEIHKSRFLQTDARRREMLSEHLATKPSPDVLDLCYLLVAPTFELCKTDPGYKLWVKAFGGRTAIVSHPLREKDVLNKTSSIQELLNYLRAKLVHLDSQMFEIRHLMVLRLIALSMSNHAKSQGAFHGADADFFLSNLVDVVAGIFTAEVSSKTTALAKGKH